MSKAGDFEMDVWGGGYPVFCVLKHNGIEIRVTHHELSDLFYVVQKGMHEARQALRTPSGDLSGEVGPP